LDLLNLRLLVFGYVIGTNNEKLQTCLTCLRVL